MWTPWRIAFIRGPKAPECIFCAKARERDDQKNYVVFRGAHSFVLLNTYPYAAGHLMIAPYQHIGSLEELPAEVTTEIMELAKRSMRALRQSHRAEAFNVGANIGAPAGAGIADHVHLHVVPRWVGDSNFMPVVGDVRLIPETLDETYTKLLSSGFGQSTQSAPPGPD
ncbi:MAG TPA: HIT domain-containing protein [Chloroflexota bacterium]|nr:HIT domain-containing protein [Chloroflexota bacterium]